MTRPIRLRRLSHPNIVLDDVEKGVERYGEMYGARMIRELSGKDWRACLIEIGGIIIELFAPHALMLNARLGPHVLGVEFEADMEEVRRVMTERGIRAIRDINVALHSHPADCLGVDFEFYGDSFYTPYCHHLEHQLMTSDYWRDEHPLGLTGLKGLTLATGDLAGAQQFLQSFIACDALREELRPHIGARSVRLITADCYIDLMSPAGDGAVRTYLETQGRGMRSLVFGVRDLDQARRHFAGLQIEIVPGSTADSIEVPAAANLGIAFEFTE